MRDAALAMLRSLPLLLLSLVLLAAATEASTYDCVEVWLVEETGAPGDTLSIPIEISDVTGLEVRTAQLAVTYETGLVAAVDCDDGGTMSSNALVTCNVVDAGGGMESLLVSILNPAFFSGAGTLIRVIFAVDELAPPGVQVFLNLEALLNEGNPCAVASGAMLHVAGAAGIGRERPSLAAANQPLTLRVAPLPARAAGGSVNLFLDGLTEPLAAIKLFDACGRLVAAAAPPCGGATGGDAAVNGGAVRVTIAPLLDDVPAGLYIVRAMTRRQVAATKLIVVR